MCDDVELSSLSWCPWASRVAAAAAEQRGTGSIGTRRAEPAAVVGRGSAGDPQRSSSLAPRHCSAARAAASPCRVCRCGVTGSCSGVSGSRGGQRKQGEKKDDAKREKRKRKATRPADRQRHRQRKQQQHNAQHSAAHHHQRDQHTQRQEGGRRKEVKKDASIVSCLVCG